MRSRFITANTVCAYLMIASVAVGKENDDSQQPQRLRDLFEVKQTVLVGMSTTNALYTIQLLSVEQARQLEAEDARRVETEVRLTRIEKLLEEDLKIETSAKLLKERQEIQRKQRLTVYSRRLGSAYVVTHVGEDYVSLSKSEFKRYIPFSSIRYMYRSKNLGLTGQTTIGRRRSSRGDSTRSTGVRIRNAETAELARVVKELYSDTDLTITVDSVGKTLTLESQETELSSIRQLIETLDARAAQAPARKTIGKSSLVYGWEERDITSVREKRSKKPDATKLDGETETIVFATTLANQSKVSVIQVKVTSELCF